MFKGTYVCICIYNVCFYEFEYYICRSIATPARTHLDGFAFVFKLNVHMYVGPNKDMIALGWE